MKVCKVCKLKKDRKYFSNHSVKQDGLRDTCKICDKVKRKKFYEANRDKILLHDRDKHRERRLTVLRHYGGKIPECKCCGEKTINFLAIDHIKGGGNKHKKELKRRGTAFVHWLIKNNFPLGFQILCHNCNMAKGFYGFCPHLEDRVSELEKDMAKLKKIINL